MLLVDTHAQVQTLLSQFVADGAAMRVTHVKTMSDARTVLSRQSIDLALIREQLPDGSGLDLAAELHRSKRLIRTILLSDQPSLDAAVAAMRAGVSDFIAQPLDLKQLNERVRQVMRKQVKDREQARRVRRLKRACRKLSQARAEVSDQVDVLCNDLITAYQELANQVNHVMHSSEYSGIIRGELDFESLLRKTLEFLVEKAGATNAAIFLPSSMDEFSLGGYVNYDCSAEAADLLLQHLGDVVAPKVAQRDELIHITDNAALTYWIGPDAAYLADSHVMAFACHHENEALAVIVLFRDSTNPYDDTIQEAALAVAPILGEALAKVIRIHHRALPETLYDEENGDDIPF